MINNVRLTENGDSRVTEEDSYRIIESYAAEADLSSDGATLFVAERRAYGVISLLGEGLLESAPISLVWADADLEATATMSGMGEMVYYGSAELVSSAAMIGHPGMLLQARANFGWATSYRITEEGDYRITEDGQRIIADTAVAYITVRRITEDGTERVTEDGLAYRIAVLLTGGTLEGHAQLIHFSGSVHYNDATDWKDVEPWVKYAGEWVKPKTAYIKHNGAWRRFH